MSFQLPTGEWYTYIPQASPDIGGIGPPFPGSTLPTPEGMSGGCWVLEPVAPVGNPPPPPSGGWILESNSPAIQSCQQAVASGVSVQVGVGVGVGVGVQAPATQAPVVVNSPPVLPTMPSGGCWVLEPISKSTPPGGYWACEPTPQAHPQPAQCFTPSYSAMPFLTNSTAISAPQDMKPADDDPNRFYWVRELDGQWTQRSRRMIEDKEFGPFTWYATDGRFYATRQAPQ